MKLLLALVAHLAVASSMCADFSTIAACADGVKPTLRNDGCPSCIPAFKCTKSDLQACRPPVCQDEETPTRDGCCPSCKPKLPTCNEQTRAACKTTMSEANFPTCSQLTKDTKVADVFNKETCCPACKRPARARRGACTKAEFKTCAKTTPECADGQTPEVEEGQCCKTCIRSQAKQLLRAIAACSEIPDCAEGERPARVEGEAGSFSCPTCKPPRPTCTPACGARQLCVRTKEEGSPKCRGGKKLKLRLRARVAAGKAFAKGATAEEVKATLIEMVERYCDEPQNEDKCAKHKQALIDGMTVRLSRDADASGDGEVEVEVDVPEAESTGEARRRLLASDSPADLLQEAADASTDPELQVSVDGTDNDSGASAYGPTAMIAGVAVSVAMIGLF